MSELGNNTVARVQLRAKLKRAALTRAIRKYNKPQQGVALLSFIAGAAWAFRFIQKQTSPKSVK